MSLFRTKIQDFDPGLPSNLAIFEQITEGRLGTARSLIAEHTILPSLVPFHRAEVAQSALRYMINSEAQHIQHLLRLLGARRGSIQTLRACPRCMTEDERLYGVAYWHLSHQYPGVLICSRHHRLLHQCIRTRRWLGRLTWTLPSEAELQVVNHSSAGTVPVNTLIRLADAALTLSRFGRDRVFQAEHVREAYRRQLQTIYKADWTSMSHDLAAISFMVCYDELAPYAQLGIPRSLPTAKTFLRSMLRGRRLVTDPVQHLLMITWLFGHIKSFVKAYNRIADQDHRSEFSV